MKINSASGLIVLDANTGTATSTNLQYIIGVISPNNEIISAEFITLAIDLTVFTGIQLGSATILSTDQVILDPGSVSVGSGARNFTITGLSITKLTILSNTIIAIPFISGFTFTKQLSTAIYSLSLSMTITSITNFDMVISTSSSCLVTSVRYSWIIYDKTSLETSQTYFADSGSSIGQSSSPTSTISLLSAKQQCFFLGLFSMTSISNTDLQFSQGHTTPYSLTSTTGYTGVGLYSVNFRQRNCPAANPYYRMFNEMCYSACPGYTMQNNADNFCSECHYSCYGCTISLSATTCSACASSDHRTLSAGGCPCDQNYYDTGVSVCSACDLTCLTCSGSLATNCLSCNATKLLSLSGTACVCPSVRTFYSGTCTLCSTLQVGCLYCTGATCTTCDSSLYRTSDGAGGCICAVGYALNGANTCQACSSYMVGCLTCSNNLTCSTCDTTSHFVLTGSSCTCQAGLILSGVVCLDTCGDGMILSLPCDDGNLISGDGCSATCQPQANYTCHALIPTAPSVCSYNQPLSLTFTSLKKNPYSNSLTIKLQVSPTLPLLNSLNFLQIISSSIPELSLTGATYSNGQLTVSANYNSSIQGSLVVLNLVPPTTLINSFAMQPSYLPFVMNPTNSAANCYSNETYVQSKAIAVILKVCASAALALMIVGHLYRGLLAAELMNVMQLVFFSVSISTTIPPPNAAVSELSGFVNGFIYRPLSAFTGNPALESMNMTNQFLGSCNIMILFQFIVLVIGGIFWIINVKMNEGAQTNLKRIAVFVLNQVCMMYTLFNLPNLAFSMGVYIRTEVASPTSAVESRISNWVCILIGLGMVVTSLYSSFSGFSFSQSVQLLKDDSVAKWKLAQYHPAFLCIHKLLIGLCMGLAYGTAFRGLAPLTLQLAYFLYCVIKRPFRKTLIVARHILNEAALLVIFTLSFVDNFFTVEQISTALVWGQTALATACVLVSYGCLVHEGIRQYCPSSNALKTYPINQAEATEPNLQPSIEQKVETNSDQTPLPKLLKDLPKLRTRRPERRSPKKQENAHDQPIGMWQPTSFELTQPEQNIIYL